jgi:hypothetical protein
MTPTSSALIRTSRLPPGRERKAEGFGSEPYPFDWIAFALLHVHPMRVQIIEAMSWIDQPLSASDLRKVFGGRFDLSFISYHLTELAKLGVMELVWKREVRGATEKFYFFRSC